MRFLAISFEFQHDVPVQSLQHRNSREVRPSITVLCGFH
jgi:hypothetical protein